MMGILLIQLLSSLSLDPSYTWSSGLGIKPAVPAAATFLACHQLWSSLLMIWRMSPVLKGMPAWAQGIRSSSIGSYSNWARTKMSHGGGADRYEGTIWRGKMYFTKSVSFDKIFKPKSNVLVPASSTRNLRWQYKFLGLYILKYPTLNVTLPLASLSSFWRLSIDWFATLIPLISLISSPTWRVAWKYLCQYFAHTQKVILSAAPSREAKCLENTTERKGGHKCVILTVILTLRSDCLSVPVCGSFLHAWSSPLCIFLKQGNILAVRWDVGWQGYNKMDTAADTPILKWDNC